MRALRIGVTRSAVAIQLAVAACRVCAADHGDWIDLPNNNSTVAVRFINEKVQCASYDGVECAWGKTAEEVTADTASMLRPVVCGAPYEKLHGNDGYSVEGHWCSEAYRAFSGFDMTKRIIFKDNFRSDLSGWILNIDARYKADERPATSPLVSIIQPRPNELPSVRMEVPGLPGTFRSELARLPWEEGLHERWYGQNVAVESPPPEGVSYIVMQWHGVMGKAKVGRNFPNLSIELRGDRWVIKRAYGDPARIERKAKALDVTVTAGAWATWVVHAKWSTGDDGLIQVWLDGNLVWEDSGPNTYFTGERHRTPYFMTGIYKPSRKGHVTEEPPIVVYVSDFKMGRHDATYNDVSPVKLGVITGTEEVRMPDLGPDANNGTVAYIVPPQPGVDGPRVMTWGRNSGSYAIITAELTRVSDRRAYPVRFRAWRENGCIPRPMNEANGCNGKASNALVVKFDQDDNKTLPAGRFLGEFHVLAQGWHDPRYYARMVLRADMSR